MKFFKGNWWILSLNYSNKFLVAISKVIKNFFYKILYIKWDSKKG